MLYPGIGIITPARPFPSVIPVEIIPIMTCVAKQTITFSVTTRFIQVIMSWYLLIFVFLSQLCSPLYTQNKKYFPLHVLYEISNNDDDIENDDGKDKQLIVA